MVGNSTYALVGVGVDSTTVNSATIALNSDVNGNIQAATAEYGGYPSSGRHYYTWLEWLYSAVTTTFYAPYVTGGASGMILKGMF
jgi:hypothetical protein